MKISIITACYNSEKYIEETIKSVINQTYNDVEYIVVDGMSTDSTPQIIEKYRENISIYLRGKDKNMYDAINKGMAVSTGDFIEILNSDDVLSDNLVIENVVKWIKKYRHEYKVFYGDDLYFYQNIKKIKIRPKIQTSFKELLFSKQLSFVGHGAVFISRDVYETVGQYNCDQFKAAGDFDYILRVMKVYPCKHLRLLIQKFRIHEASITSSGQIGNEIDEVLRLNGYYDYSILERYFYYCQGWLRFIVRNLIPMARFFFSTSYAE